MSERDRVAAAVAEVERRHKERDEVAGEVVHDDPDARVDRISDPRLRGAIRQVYDREVREVQRVSPEGIAADSGLDPAYAHLLADRDVEVARELAETLAELTAPAPEPVRTAEMTHSQREMAGRTADVIAAPPSSDKVKSVKGVGGGFDHPDSPSPGLSREIPPQEIYYGSTRPEDERW